MADIICFLLPCSEAASQQVSTIVLSDTRYIVRRDVVNEVTIDYYPDKVKTQSPSPASGDQAIALRFSADKKSPLQGFTFGRNRDRCDLCFRDPDRRLSNIHFRIYLDKDNDGALILQDLSTNGTIVDGTLLRCRDQTKTETILKNGSKILIRMRDVSLDLEFLVIIPHREADHERAYRGNLVSYMAELDAATNLSHLSSDPLKRHVRVPYTD